MGNYDEEMLDKAMPNRLDKQISTLLARLQSPWVCDRTDNRMMGHMYKRQRKAPHRWVLYRVILNGNNLYYFNDATVCMITTVFNTSIPHSPHTLYYLSVYYYTISSPHLRMS